MTNSTTGVPPAGWFPDPSGDPTLRWWDGTQWTEQVLDAPTPPASAVSGSLLEDQLNATSSASGHAPSDFNLAEEGAPRGKNPFAWTSLTLVIIGLMAAILAPSFPLIQLFDFVAAVVFGILGIRRASQAGIGRAMAVWGLVLGTLGLIVSLVAIGVSSPAFQAGLNSARSSTGEPTARSQPAPPDATADPTPMADGLITGDGYSYSVPAGWGVPENAPADADTFAMDLAASGNFANNVNVLLSPAGVVTADDVESAGLDELEDAGATDVVVHNRVTVAGSESAHITASWNSDGLEYYIHQYYPTHNNQTYIVTFSYARSVSDIDTTRITESVLTSWAWN